MCHNNTLMLTVKDSVELQNALDTAAKETDKNVEIIINGTIYLDKTLELKDNSVPITIKGENAVIDGGYRISGFRSVEVNGVHALCASVPRDITDNVLFDQLFVNGKRRYRSVFPDEKTGFTGVIDEKKKIHEPDWLTPNNMFDYNGVIPRFTQPEAMELHICHGWVHERLEVAKIDYKKNRVHTKAYTFFAVGAGSFGGLVNVFETLKNPGEYYIDKKNSLLYYIPDEDENADNIEVVVPAADKFIQFTNASNVSIGNVSFRYVSGRYKYNRYSPAGIYDGNVMSHTCIQAECELGGSISFTDSNNCKISDCIFSHLGVYGVDVIGSSNNISVENCIFTDLGCGAMKTQHNGTRGVKMSNIRFANNKVAGYGKAYLSACAVLFTHVKYSTIENNEICDGEYSGISCGWTWSYKNEGYIANSICNNHLYNIGNGRLADMGGIYTLGVQPLTRIAGNHIHDVRAGSILCWGIYLDEGSSCMTVEDNLVHDIEGDAMHIHYGKNNLIRNNIFASCNGSLVCCTRNENHIQFYLDHNIMYNESERMVRTPACESTIRSDSNLYYSDSGSIGFSRASYSPDEKYISLDQWRDETKNDLASINEDPLFVNAAEKDFRIKKDSPAITKLGFMSSKWIEE